MTQQETLASDPLVLRVRGGTASKALGAKIAGEIERGRIPRIEFIGAGACCQAIKAVAEANKILSKSGRNISVLPLFVKRDVPDNHDISAMQLRVKVEEIG
jgi:stage V sporulation protein SpoVS